MTLRYSDFVDYTTLDPFKRRAMEAFASTLANPERLGIKIIGVGETAAILDFVDYDFMLAFNVEDLGTKNLISDKMYQELLAKQELARSFKKGQFYSNLGQDVLAMAVTDLVAVGADPIAYADIIATGDSDWFKDSERILALLQGYTKAANLAGCAIPQGETPTLPNIVFPGTLNLAGGAVGLIRPKTRFTYGQKLRAGDMIYGLPSEGICANGLSKARMIAEKLPESYFTRLPDNQTLGEALLSPTPILVRPIIQLFEEGVDLHYISPITGHGWRKLSRARFPFRYVVENIPEPPMVFKSLIEWGKEHGFDVSDEENYQVWNMGIFITLIAPREDGETITSVMEKLGIQVYVLGRVEAGEKEVVIRPKNLVYRG